MKKTSVSIVFLSIILFAAILSGVWTFLLKESVENIRSDLKINKDYLTQQSLLNWVLDNKLDSLADAAILIKTDQPELSEKLQAFIDKQKRVNNNISTFHSAPSDEFILDELEAEKEMKDDGNLFAADREAVKTEDLEDLSNNIDISEELTTSAISTTFLNFKIGRNKVYYDGSIKNGKAQGEGRGVFDNGVIYEGSWKNNLPNGEGVQKWPDGRKYEGDFSNGLKSGTGTFIWNNQEKYVGEWHNDQRHGKGILYDKKGKIKHQGEWRANIFIK